MHRMTITSPASGKSPVYHWANPDNHGATCRWSFATDTGIRDNVEAACWYLDPDDGFVHFVTGKQLIASVRGHEIQHIRATPQEK